jgi:hypothetical protein
MSKVNNETNYLTQLEVVIDHCLDLIEENEELNTKNVVMMTRIRGLEAANKILRNTLQTVQTPGSTRRTVEEVRLITAYRALHGLTVDKQFTLDQ